MRRRSGIRPWFVSLLLATVLVGLPALATAQTDGSPVPQGSPSAAGEILAAWTQLGADGTLQARSVVTASCPEIVVDGVSTAMSVRAEPVDAHPVTVCEAPVSDRAELILIDERALPGLVEHPERVVAIGDTGCRIAEEWHQDCNDPVAWPFAAVATEAAASEPDLVIHTGDYLYREFECPAGAEGCAGSPFGDTWATWNADFFEPAAALLSAAPWLFVRGNHESCERAGEGWFRLLDPAPYVDECAEFTDPWAVQLGSQRAIVLDAAAAIDVGEDASIAAKYGEQFAAVEALLAGEPAWLLSHKSFWSLGADGEGNALEWTTASFIEAGFAQPPAGIELVVAGHVHMAQMMQFSAESGRPLVLVVGNAGTALEQFGGGVFTGDDLGDATLIEGVRYAAHGFTLLESSSGGWVATMRQVGGANLMACLIAEKRAGCLQYAEPTD